ncbi:MAG: alpha/beta hydrolase family protein [Bacillota bacterium]
MSRWLIPDRVGILGWSHGGLITLMNIFNHPDAYKVAYAGVPVSDLVARMGYKGPHYQSLFSAPYHIGKTAVEDPAEYIRRSPAWQVERLETPLLIHTTTNDEDVNVLEVLHLIKALKAAGKEFEYKVYENEPGGHVFNRNRHQGCQGIQERDIRFPGPLSRTGDSDTISIGFLRDSWGKKTRPGTFGCRSG